MLLQETGTSAPGCKTFFVKNREMCDSAKIDYYCMYYVGSTYQVYCIRCIHPLLGIYIAVFLALYIS